MSTALQIGTIASKTNKLLVQRQGEQLTLSQGDAILAGDVLQNKDAVAVDIELPALNAGQANSLVTLAPESAAQIASRSAAEGSMIEVTSLTEGVELFAVSEGTDGAILQADSGTVFSGLVGAGVLSAGSVGGTSGVASIIGGGVGVAALAASSGDDPSTGGAAFNDVRVDNGDETSTDENPSDPNPSEDPDEETPGDENPENPENPDDPENPGDPVENPDEPEAPEAPVNEGVTGTPLDAVLDPLAGALGGTPLSVATDPLFGALNSLPFDPAPIGSAPNPTSALPLGDLQDNLPF